jgi:lantibiotic biosynthesis protein
MTYIISKIEKNIWESISKETRIGLLNGLSGVALFYDYLHQVQPCEDYKDKLLFIVNKINTIISEDHISSSLSSGLAGFGLMLLRMKNNFIEIDEEYFENLDLIIFEDFEEESKKNNYDFLHGAMGIAFYFIERYKTNPNNQIVNILNNFSKDIINKINTSFIDVLRNETNDNINYYSLGMAHGVSGYMNFLIYLELHFKELKYDIKAPLNTCVTFLKLHKKKCSITKQYYPNLVLIEDKKKINPLLAWCQGDLGISNALFNSGIYFKNDLVDEAIELINNIKHITLEESGIVDYAMCHGSIGVLVQYQLASINFNVDYSEEIYKWYTILKKQTNDFEEFLPFQPNALYKETNLLDGLVGLALGLLTLEKKIDTSWLEIFNLH